jgi:hypothetical protein
MMDREKEKFGIGRDPTGSSILVRVKNQKVPVTLDC